MEKSWVSVAKVDSISPGSYQAVTVGLTSIIIINSHGNFFALEDLCTHDGGELAGGTLENEEIVCPRHGAGFCIKTGAVTRPPAYEGIRRFPLRIQEGNIEIEI